MRNRCYINRKGPLLMYGSEGVKLVKAFRNIPGIDIVNVERLNLLKLAPGGHLGRFVIWIKWAFEKLDSIYGSFDKASEKKKGYVLPRAKMVNADLLGFFFFFFFFNFWVCVIGSEFVFLLLLIKKHLDLNSYDF